LALRKSAASPSWPENDFMKARLAALVCVGILSACSAPENPPEKTASSAAPAPADAAPVASSGIEFRVDTAAGAQDYFYRHVNDKWLDLTEIPADKHAYGLFC